MNISRCGWLAMLVAISASSISAQFGAPRQRTETSEAAVASDVGVFEPGRQWEFGAWARDLGANWGAERGRIPNSSYFGRPIVKYPWQLGYQPMDVKSWGGNAKPPVPGRAAPVGGEHYWAFEFQPPGAGPEGRGRSELLATGKLVTMLPGEHITVETKRGPVRFGATFAQRVLISPDVHVGSNVVVYRLERKDKAGYITVVDSLGYAWSLPRDKPAMPLFPPHMHMHPTKMAQPTGESAAELAFEAGYRRARTPFGMPPWGRPSGSSGKP